MSSIFVIYHQNCPDGFSSAWVAWKKFKNKAQYLGLRDNRNVWSHNVNNSEFYFLDVAPNKERVKKLKKNNNRVVVIDHHLTSKKVLALADDYRWDDQHSACVLTWHYFFPRKKIPKFLLYVEDEDLWRWKLPYAREIMSYREIISFDFREWSKLVRKVENYASRRSLIKQGKAIYLYKQKIIREITQRAHLVKFHKWTALAVEVPFVDLISEIGNALLEKHPPLSLICLVNKNYKKVSLRSDGSVNVAQIAEQYGGGGHFRAASFTLNLSEPWPWQEIK